MRTGEFTPLTNPGNRVMHQKKNLTHENTRRCADNPVKFGLGLKRLGSGGTGNPDCEELDRWYSHCGLTSYVPWGKPDTLPDRVSPREFRALIMNDNVTPKYGET